MFIARRPAWRWEGKSENIGKVVDYEAKAVDVIYPHENFMALLSFHGDPLSELRYLPAAGMARRVCRHGTLIDSTMREISAFLVSNSIVAVDIKYSALKDWSSVNHNFQLTKVYLEQVETNHRIH